MRSHKFAELLKVASELAQHAKLPHFWLAYKRGLQAGFFGPAAVGEDEHHAWLSLGASEDPHQHERHRGYLEGHSAGVALHAGDTDRDL